MKDENGGGMFGWMRLLGLLTHGLCPLAALAAEACLLYTAREFTAEGLAAAAVTALGLAAMGVLGTVRCMRGREERWRPAAETAAGAVAFMAGVVTISIFSSATGDAAWMTGMPVYACLWAGITVPLMMSLWVLAGQPMRVRPEDDGMTRVLREALPMGGMLAGLVTMGFLSGFCLMIARIHDLIWVAWLTVFGILGAGWFMRFTVLMTRLHRVLRDRFPVYAFAIRFLPTLGFPLGGLLLNRTVPFPFDCQNLWCYGLTLFTGTVLLLPAWRWTVFLRWVTFPFTLYFFLVFLPWLPVGALLILIFGMGLPVLVPTFLFAVHTAALRERRLPLWAAVLALAVLPGGFLLKTEHDRAATRTLIEHVGAPDYTSGRDTLPLPEADARRAAHLVYAYEYGTYAPLLSLWTGYRLFDGMHPRQDVMDALIARFGRPRDTFGTGSLLDRRPSGRRRPTLWHAGRTEKPAKVAFRGLGTRQVTAEITLPTDADREFVSELTLADGVWAVGLRLQMPDGTWRSGSLRDRRAATWVYERLVSRAADPALLVLDGPTRGSLRVFPLLAEAPRRLEIDLLLPEPGWCAEPLALGLRETPLRAVAPGEDERRTVSVCFVSAGAETVPEGFGLYVVGGAGTAVLEAPPEKVPERADFDARRALRFAQGYAYAHGLRLGEAVFLGGGWDDIAGLYHPEPPRARLPKLPQEDPWQVGARMWALAEHMTHNRTLDRRDELRELAKTCPVLTPESAYIVLEEDAQERAMALKDRMARGAGRAFDIDPTDDREAVRQDSPGLAAMLAACLILLLLGGFLRCVRRVVRR